MKFNLRIISILAIFFTAQPGTSHLDKIASNYPPSSLPVPTGLHLKYVLLGVGTQNYTCIDNASEPGTTGAVAKLYDIGTRLNSDPQAQSKICGLSRHAYDSFRNGTLNSYLAKTGFDHFLGRHYFTPFSTNTSLPTFSLYKVKASPFPIAIVSKKNAADAPRVGDIQWLRLVDDSGRSSGGVDTVYRLETAGGAKPATCEGREKTFEEKYTAQYWIYGSSTDSARVN